MILIILALLVLKNARLIGNRCDCLELMNQNDCLQSNCAWMTIGGISGCSGQISTKRECRYLTTQQQCDESEGCAWKISCSPFTTCTDYFVNSPDDCYLKGTHCIPGSKTEEGLIKCEIGTFTCSQIRNSSICTQKFQSSMSKCFWNDSCIEEDISNCSTIVSARVCQMYGCVYLNSSCLEPKCNQITSQSECTFIRSDDLNGKKQICQWINDSCIDAQDTLQLIASTCHKNTGGTHTWDNNTCIACKGYKITNITIYEQSTVYDNGTNSTFYNTTNNVTNPGNNTFNNISTIAVFQNSTFRDNFTNITNNRNSTYNITHNKNITNIANITTIQANITTIGANATNLQNSYNINMTNTTISNMSQPNNVTEINSTNSNDTNLSAISNTNNTIQVSSISSILMFFAFFIQN